MKLKYRKPLIIIGPKTLLRLQNCKSNIKEFEEKTKFQTILSDTIINFETW
jgi:2-oxoglutarate dehydrogenase complex dehydrogenase (E1) component-like enzyme